MAGDWIKMREDLHEDPAVLWMAQQLDTRAEMVVGYCHRFWGLVSRQTCDGCLKGPTLLSLGTVLGLPGFPELLVEAGWLEYDDSDPNMPVVTIPKFEVHLSESAKKRALAAQRKQKERAEKEAREREEMSRKSCDKNVTREEKRRVSSSNEEDRGSRLPNGFSDSFLADWNGAVPFAQARALSAKRLEALSTRYADRYWRDNYQEALARIPKSPFLRGENDRGWKINLDFFLKPDTVLNILEGKYDGTGKAHGVRDEPGRDRHPERYANVTINRGSNLEVAEPETETERQAGAA